MKERMRSPSVRCSAAAIAMSLSASMARCRQARREVFLLAVVVGEAVRRQVDAVRQVGQQPALDALLVEQPRRAVEDGLALVVEAFSHATRRFLSNRDDTTVQVARH